jgi:hypothetical protein
MNANLNQLLIISYIQILFERKILKKTQKEKFNFVCFWLITENELFLNEKI